MLKRPPIPSHVRQSVLRRANYRCEDCGAKDIQLEMHHLTYRRAAVIPNPVFPDEGIFGYETPEVLAALCRECHHERHIDPAGQFCTDPEVVAVRWHNFNTFYRGRRVQRARG
jgi:5-methylcytosine-specific restriction endonuclease McrA